MPKGKHSPKKRKLRRIYIQLERAYVMGKQREEQRRNAKAERRQEVANDREKEALRKHNERYAPKRSPKEQQARIRDAIGGIH